MELLIPTFFGRKLLMRKQKLFWAKKYGEVVLNWRTNDQIMPRFGGSFIDESTSDVTITGKNTWQTTNSEV